MPTLITVQLDTPMLVPVDGLWMSEATVLDILQRGLASSPTLERRTDHPRPYAQSPMRHSRARRLTVQEVLKVSPYQWQVSLLDDSLTDAFVKGLQATQTMNVGGKSLTVTGFQATTKAYQEIVETSRHATNADALKQFSLEFVSPAVLQRDGLLLLLPDPPLVFHSYLRAWNAYAPATLHLNVSLIDAIQFHINLADFKLAARRANLSSGDVYTGCSGWIRFVVSNWRKLGSEFLYEVHTLARFACFCGTGELTYQGMGQTRYQSMNRSGESEDFTTTLTHMRHGRPAVPSAGLE